MTEAIQLKRMGDFYEAFDGDAVDLARILGIAIAKRDGHPMAGFPVCGADEWLQKLTAANRSFLIDGLAL